MQHATDLYIQALSILFLLFTTRTSSTIGRRPGKPARAAWWAWKTVSLVTGPVSLNAAMKVKKAMQPVSTDSCACPSESKKATSTRSVHSSHLHLNVQQSRVVREKDDQCLRFTKRSQAHRKGIGLEWKLEELELRAPSGDKDRHRPLVISWSYLHASTYHTSIHFNSRIDFIRVPMIFRRFCWRFFDIYDYKDLKCILIVYDIVQYGP